MIVQRVRISCPSCSHGLSIRVADIGKLGECKYCGHRFRPRAQLAPAPLPDRAGSPSSGPEDPAASLGPLVQNLERELQQTWARVMARQASMVEQLMAELGGLSVPTLSRSPAQSQAPESPGESRSGLATPPASNGVQADWTDGLEPPDEDLEADPDAVASLGVLLQNAQSIVSPSTPPPDDAAVASIERRVEVSGGGMDSLQVQGEVHVVEAGPATPAADVAEWLDRLAHERDVARAECERLRQEVHLLRSDLAGRLTEVARLRRSAEKHRSVRNERDRLSAERVMLGREATQLQARLVEVQVALVEVEAELEDYRDRVRAERQEWQQQRQGLLDEAERRLAEQREGFEAERRAWHEQLEIHRTVEHEAEALQVKVKKLRSLYDETRQQRDEALRQVEAIGQRCARLSAYLDEAEAERRALEQGHQAERERLTAALNEALEETESALGREAAHVARIQALQAALARHQGEMAMSLPSPSSEDDPG